MDFNKNKTLDDLIIEINELLAPVEKNFYEKITPPENCSLFLLGTSRCGSTLFMQWAASLNTFSYPSNFLSRFPKAPYIGALIYEMVTNSKYQYLDEFEDVNNQELFLSSIGKTKGFKAPHEFWYFWREFMNFPEVPFSEEEFEKNFDFEGLQEKLNLMQLAFGKPFLCKAKIVNWYLESMATHMKNVVFIHLHRDPIAVVRSLLKTRKKWTGSSENWFAWKPREYDELRNMDKYHQVAGQIYYIEREILSKKKLLGERYLSFSYEEFCENPKQVYKKIGDTLNKFSESEFQMPTYKGKTNFVASNPISKEDSEIEKAWNYFTDTYGALKY